MGQLNVYVEHMWNKKREDYQLKRVHLLDQVFVSTDDVCRKQTNNNIHLSKKMVCLVLTVLRRTLFMGES